MTIWNGLQFQFENILQAHNASIKAMEWTPEETVLVSGDQLGVIKFWDQFLYNFQTVQAHKDSICDISIAPTGLKFCSCADDSHAKSWDLRTGEEERAFTGHGWDVKCCSWHPTKGLVATGSKDAQIKLWDPRAGEAITTIYCHKNTVTRVKWSPSGQYLASGSKDQLVMLMDIRTMSVRKVLKAHQKEVTSLCWHPETDSLLASGGYDSQLHFWDTQGASTPIKSLPAAHEGPIWSLAWHPLGHLLVSGSNDYSTRFWSRARPGDRNFDEILPKKLAAPGDLPASAIPPPPTVSMSVLDSGIFAGNPFKEPPQSCPIMEGAKVKEAATLALDNAPAKDASGLSHGEGADRKEILDTSDFDALEEKTTTPSPPVSDKAFNKAGAPAPADAPAAKATEPAKAPAAAPATAGQATNDDWDFQPGQQVRILAPPAMVGKLGSVEGPTTKKADVWKVKLESGNVFEFPTQNLQDMAAGFAQAVSAPAAAAPAAAAPAPAVVAAPATSGDDDLDFLPGQQVQISAPPAMAGKKGFVEGPTTKKADAWKVRLESGNVFEFPTQNLTALAPVLA